MAKKLEEHLYRSAHTKEEYVDPASLKRRLHLIAKGVDIGIPGESDDTQSHSSSTAQSMGGGGSVNPTVPPPVPLEAVSQGIGNGNAPAAQDPQQLLLMQAMQQNNDGQNSIGSIPEWSTTAGQELGADQKKTILLQQQRRLLLLRHASKCNNGPSCRTKFCPQMVTLWKHMKKCQDKQCKVSHCLSSRCVLNHYRVCKSEGKTAGCAICAPVIKHIRENTESNIDGYGNLGSLEADELDTLALGSDGGLEEDPLRDASTVSDGVCLPVVDAAGGAPTLPNIDPLTAFNGLSPNPPAASATQAAVGISQPNNLLPQAAAAGMPQSFLDQLANGGGTQQAVAPQAGQPANVGGSAEEINQQIQQKQLLLQQVQQQKVRMLLNPMYVCIVHIEFLRASFFSFLRLICSAKIRNCNSS